MKIALKNSLVIASIGLLSACGGGSDDSTPSVNKAEGAYQGTLSTGAAFNALILENDDAWVIYGTSTVSGLLVTGFMQTSGNSANGTYQSSSARDYAYTGAVSAGNLNATYRQGSSLSGAATLAGQSISFSGTGMPAASFDYNQPALLSNIAGQWSGATIYGDRGAINIAASNSTVSTLSGTVGACTVSGQVRPRSSGKNVFDLSVTYSGTRCSISGQTMTGIAIGVGGQLITAGTNASKTLGTLFLATR